MGFWSSVGSIAKGAVDSLAEASKEAEGLTADYRRENDDYLKRKVQSGRMAEKMAATKILKERGYGS
ncbi:MAG: hypothetical protein E6Q75_07075 [Rheinheimera sp.]|nr:MAG: hypothetical protein E6Q75_07075 [Rheinheimera sp.]